MRHGQSESNLAKYFAGQMNVHLSELGHKQAEVTSEYLKTIPVDVIYSSDLYRAYETAQHTAEKKGLPIHTSPKLREIFAGGGKNYARERRENHLYLLPRDPDPFAPCRLGGGSP